MQYSKLRFYLSYIYYKLRIPLDVKKNSSSILVAETLWLINNLFKKKIDIPTPFKKTYFETKFGKFNVTPDVISLVTLSPAFERLDTDRLSLLMDKELKNKKKVIFMDIGAYFGDYTVRYGNEFKRNNNFKIICFEPGTEYLSVSTLKQLKENIKLNKLKNVKIYNFGIGSKTGKNEIGIMTKPLDKVLNKEYSKYDVAFIKLDIDDFVEDGLKGIQKAVDNFKEVYLLVEDFVKPKPTFKHLEKNNYTFLYKLTTYNSFWYKSNVK
jgi:hypothetical protein